MRCSSDAPLPDAPLFRGNPAPAGADGVRLTVGLLLLGAIVLVRLAGMLSMN